MQVDRIPRECEVHGGPSPGVRLRLRKICSGSELSSLRNKMSGNAHPWNKGRAVSSVGF